MDPSTQQALVRAQSTLIRQSRLVKGVVEREIRSERAADDARARARAFGNSASSLLPFVYGYGPDAYYGANHARDVRVFDRLAQQNLSVRAREVFALSSTNLALSFTDLMTAVRAWDAGYVGTRLHEVARDWSMSSLASLSTLLADQQIRDEDLEDSMRVARLVRSVGRAPDNRAVKKMRQVEVETALLTGHLQAAASLIDDHDLVSRTDHLQLALWRANLKQLEGGGSWARPVNGWLDELAESYDAAGIAPPYISSDAGEDLFDRLAADSPGVDSPVKITVIMPTFKGQAHIAQAVRCIIEQSWSNWELIVVDDASPESDWQEVLSQIPEDPRITVLRQERNTGNYLARRRALEIATGAFVTVHDDDDWSHPDKLRVQVTDLLDRPDAVGNMSMMARIDENAQFVRINSNEQIVQKNYSSMMIRRSVLEAVGGWDDAVRAADAELHDRLTALFGDRLDGVGGVPLSFVRVRRGSLTSGQIRRGYLHPVRIAYGLSFGEWHDRLSPETGGQLEVEDRPFVQPVGQRWQSRNGLTGEVDILFVSDLRFSGGNSTLLAAEISAAAGAGWSVGVAHLPSPILRGNAMLNSKVAEAITLSGAHLVTLADPVEAKLLVVRNPSVLEYADNLPCNVRPRSVRVVVNNAPLEVEGNNVVFDLRTSSRHARRLFGVDAEITPESPQTREQCEAIFPECDYSEHDWPGFVDEKIFVPVSRHVSSDRRPRVGRHSRDHALKWPGAADFLEIYHRPELYETHVLGGMNHVDASALKTAGDALTVHEFGDVEPVEFLAGLDFWVYFGADGFRESFGMAVVEAMASGLVVILPHYFEALFGEAAVYAQPGQVADMVTEYWGDDSAYNQQAARARAAVEQRFSRASFQRRISELISRIDGAPSESASAP